MNTIPKKLGRYNIVREVGRGAMGVVYKALDPVIEREVALKAILLAFQVSNDEKKIYLNRFYREAKAAGKLNHPNIVTIYDVNEDKESGTPFIVMEFLEGTTLQEIIASGILLPMEDVNSIIMQMADGLHYAHKSGVIHRDIKSANILILEGMKVKITDFGIARLSTSDLTRTGQFIGTPNYMSPEQLEGKGQVDGRSDLFSLGVIFYLLLTGERPFSGESFTSISYKIVHVDPIPPRTINPAVPEVYNKMLVRLLAKDPSDRYADGAELVQDLKKLQNLNMDIPEVEVIPIEEVTVYAKRPTKDEVELVELQEIGSLETIDSLPTGHRPAPAKNPAFNLLSKVPKPALIAAVLVIVALAAWALISLSSEKNTTKQITPPPPLTIDPGQSMSKQDQLRTKWDLASNYYENGFYDRATEELNELLKIDPTNTDARKFLDLVKERQKKEQENSPEQPLPQGPVATPSVEQQPAHTESDRSASPAKKEILTGDNVSFEFEHAFPSGTLYIYQKDKLIFEGPLKAVKEKVLMIPVYRGKLTGKLKLPFGETKLVIRVICREQGVSAFKDSVAKLSEGVEKKMKIKYIKSSRQLEIKWT